MQKNTEEINDDFIDILEINQNPQYCTACSKQFTKQGNFDQHLQGKKHQKAKQEQENKSMTNKEDNKICSQKDIVQYYESNIKSITKISREYTQKELALQEYSIQNFADILRIQINETRSFLEKKQTLSIEEIEAEIKQKLKDLEDSKNDDDASDKDDEQNPGKNMPLGPDGEPIPLWQYKQHGFNHQYTCEICGNAKYRGERNFYRHFRESRHTYYLSLLGIDNTQEFMNITTIQDAQALDKKLRVQRASKQFHQADEEEVEDALGNVYKLSVYKDLKSKGLVS